MRGIYNLRTLDKSAECPIISKVLGTFISFCVIGGIIASVVLFHAFGQYKNVIDVHKLCQDIAAVFGLWFLFQTLTLRILLSKSISPLIKIITVAKTATCLKKIDIPPNLSEELREIYDIVNNSIERLREAQSQTIQHERSAAVARVTQMLAHDVRKPFSVLSIGMRMLAESRDQAMTKKIIERLTPEVQKALNHANGLISDVLEIGSNTSNLMTEAIAPENLIDVALKDIFQLYPKSNVKLSFDLQHIQKVRVHGQKVNRLLVNILANAIQAMNQHGHLWIHTRQVPGYIEFCLGNDHSYIEEDDLEQLFQAFFTKGKSSGTGLGLAIAQKVVQAHEGKIWCTSTKDMDHPDGKVEFWFTLPASMDFYQKPTMKLPESCSQYRLLVD